MWTYWRADFRGHLCGYLEIALCITFFPAPQIPLSQPHKPSCLLSSVGPPGLLRLPLPVFSLEKMPLGTKLVILQSLSHFVYLFSKITVRSSVVHSLHVQFSSVAQSCLTLCDLMNRSMPGLPVHHKLPGFTQTHVHQVGDAIQPSHPLSSPPPPAPNPSQHQGLFKWITSSHQVAKVLEVQLQHQSFQWTPRTDLL